MVGIELKSVKAFKQLENEKYKLFKKQDFEKWQINDPSMIKQVYRVRNNYEEARKFILPEKTAAVQELLNETMFFKQQLFNEVRRIIMLDYFASRDSFGEVGEQYCRHMGTNLKEWHKFINFYSDVNNARKEKDD